MKLWKYLNKIGATSEQGLTLIEAMAATVIFTFGLLAVAALINTSFQGQSNARLSTTEVNRTIISMESLKKSGYRNDNVLQEGMVFNGPAGPSNHVNYTIQDNAVVSGTKMVVMQNAQVSRNANAQAFVLNFTKPEIR